MENLPFLKTQRNIVFEAIQNVGLDPHDFEWTKRDSRRVIGNEPKQHIALVHKPTGYYYLFKLTSDNTHWAEYSPAEDSEFYLSKGTTTGQGWKTILQHLPNWLEYLKREIESPDLWMALSEDTRIIEAASASDMEDTPFSSEELKYISDGLKEIREYLATTQDLSPDKLAFINSRLEYLEKAATRQGRLAWIHTTIGVLFTITIGVALSPDAARELFRLASNVFSWLINGPLLLP